MSEETVTTGSERGPNTPPERLPTPASRRAARGPRVEVIEVPLCTTTPVFGGGVAARMPDPVAAVRGPSVRGHLRFWWRASRGHAFATPEALAEREAQVFGAAAGDGRRSPVEVQIEGLPANPPTMHHGELGAGGQYALWAAAANQQAAAAELLRPGLRFTLRVVTPVELLADVEAALRSWIRFGGYGGRTRRGGGSLTVEGEAARRWLPSGTGAAALLGVEGAASTPSTSMPRLAGATCALGAPRRDGMTAFEEATGWLRDFRQGPGGRSGEPDARAAREPVQGNRPGRSRWPEADKIRHLSRGRFDHEPLHDAEPAWPRAGFGLPIVGRFQTKARKGGWLREPDPFELRWRNAAGEVQDRLASPLIVKPLALADGTFAPLALWLDRAWPDGEVVLHKHPAQDRSAAPFDRLLGAGDTARFGPLAVDGSVSEGERLRTAFFGWLADAGKAREVR